MKKLLCFSAFIIALTIILYSCELLDEDHCQYETVESKIWNQQNGVVFAQIFNYDTYKYYVAMFGFERVNSFNSFYKIENLCPYNALSLDVNLKTIPAVAQGVGFKLSIQQMRTIKGKKVPVEISTEYMNKKTDTEYFSKKLVQLKGLLDNGPTEILVVPALICYQNTETPNFSNAIELEDWAKQIVKNIEYKANFIKYQ